MKTTVFSTRAVLLTAVLSAAIAAVCVLPVAAEAATVFNSRVGGLLANASFVKSEGCIETLTSVDGLDGKSQDNQTGQSKDAFALVVIKQWNHCTNWIDLAFGFADIAPGELSITGNLKAASLNKTIEVADVDTGVVRPVTVALDWSASGNPDPSNYNETTRDPDGTRFTLRGTGISRPAAVSGSVVDGATDRVAEAQSSTAGIYSFRSWSLLIAR